MSLQKFRLWFWLAAAYNALFGLVVGLFPRAVLGWLGMADFRYVPIFQCVGMLVGCYAMGYALVALDPRRYGAFAVIGLIGKVLGPLGFVWAASRGELPWSFGWMNVFNDVVWWPAFGWFSFLWFNGERR